MKIEEAIQQPQFKDEYQKLMINIMYTYGHLNSHMTPFFKSYDLTAQQYNVLRILRGQKGRALGVLDIQNRMLDRMSNASRIIERLRLKSLVDRKSCPKDRRSVEITITEKGLRLLGEMDSAVVEQNKSVSAGLSEKEASTLNQLLDKLRSSQV